LAGSNSGKLSRPCSKKGGDRPDRLAHVSTQSFNVTSCAWCRSQGAAGTLATCRCSNDHEHLHAGRSWRSARGEQQSRSLSASCASRLALMAPSGPSKSHKLLSMKEMLVGAVGIESTTGRNFKDLEGMLGNAKALKRNNWECKGILNGPSFFSTTEIPSQCISLTVQVARSASGSNFAARMASQRNFTRMCQTRTRSPAAASFVRNSSTSSRPLRS
jgi:hypothetical protein